MASSKALVCVNTNLVKYTECGQLPVCNRAATISPMSQLAERKLVNCQSFINCLSHFSSKNDKHFQVLTYQMGGLLCCFFFVIYDNYLFFWQHKQDITLGPQTL